MNSYNFTTKNENTGNHLDDTQIQDSDDSGNNDTQQDTVDTNDIDYQKPVQLKYSSKNAQVENQKYTDLIREESFIPQKSQNDVCDDWIQASAFIEQGNIDEAYSIILNSEDDIYLLRLMIKTGPNCYKRMDKSQSNRLFERVIKLTKSNFLDNMILNFFLEACKTDLSNHIDYELRSNMIMVLESMSKNHENTKQIKVILDYLKNI